ncbi:MAG: hypothetical protein AAGG99_08100 [Pseudomonadota bacterium]
MAHLPPCRIVQKSGAIYLLWTTDQAAQFKQSGSHVVFFNPFLVTPAANAFMRPFLTNLDKVGQSSQPQLKATVRSQIEAGGFVAKRLKANMEMPERLSRCRTPMDTMMVATSYWMEAFEDYAESSQRAARILGFASPTVVSRIGDWQPPMAPVDMVPTEPARVRDVMDVEVAETATAPVRTDTSAEYAQAA